MDPAVQRVALPAAQRGGLADSPLHERGFLRQ